MRQNPFSIYDFLGYVIPGALTLILIGFFEHVNEVTSITDLYEQGVSFIRQCKIGGSMSLLEETVIFIVLAYVVGHLVAYLSSLTVEKFSNWTYGYPSRFLLESVPSGHYFRTDECVDCGWHTPDNWEQFCALVWRLIIAVFLLPITICTILFSKCLKVKEFFVKPVDYTLRYAISIKKRELIKKLGISQVDVHDDLHRVIYHYEYENQSNHRQKMDNYVALYGFLRAMTFIFNCVTIWITIKYCHLRFTCDIDGHLALLWLLCVLVTYLFFMAFMKFYRRFTLESFMCLVIDRSLL